ncbi:cadherin-like beta sandwich domain-containing protein [Cohnella sp.]|uniref:cadherin-like beta sandwich domain-containing protein n=1 Tax=Cohnella sp. TaxID=1883426 RepID=UPI003561ECEF
MGKMRNRNLRISALIGVLILMQFGMLFEYPGRGAAAAGAGVTLDSPANGATLQPGIVRISGTYSDVTEVKLMINGTEQFDGEMSSPNSSSGTWHYDLNTAKYDGKLEMRARGQAADTRYYVWSAPVAATVINPERSKPEVAIVDPADASAVGRDELVTVRIAVNAQNPVDSVTVRVNGGPWSTAQYSVTDSVYGYGIYEYEWDTAGIGDLTSSIEARAADSQGNIGRSATAYVKVGQGTNEPITVEKQDRAMWIWEAASYNLFLNPGSRNVLDAMARDTAAFDSPNPITTLYVGVDKYMGRYLLEEDPDKIRDFIAWAHDKGYKVHACIAGGTTPPYLGAYRQYHGLAVSIFEDLLNYNIASGVNERFDGVNVDIEPYISPDFKLDPSAPDSLQVQYLEVLEKMVQRRDASGQGLPIGPAVPRWYDTSDSAKSVTFNGQTKWLSEHVQDLTDYISIMDYWDKALQGTGGIIPFAQGEIDYAERIGRPNSVVIGVETKDIADSGDPYYITFRQQGRSYMEAELRKVADHFRSSPAYGGIALHHYDTIRELPSYWGPGGYYWQPPSNETPPTAVSSGPVATALDYHRISLRFGSALSSDSEINQYHIYRSSESGFAPSSANLIGVSRGPSFIDKGLLPGIRYYYKVAAVDVNGNIGPASGEASALTGSTSLKPLIVDGMKLVYDGSRSVVTLQVVDLATKQAIQSAKVEGRFAYAGGKYVSGATDSGGLFSAGSEELPAGRQVGFFPRRIEADGYYWAQAHDKPGTATQYPWDPSGRQLEARPGAGLRGLELGDGEWNAAFSPELTFYTVRVGYEISDIDVTPVPADAQAEVRVNGTALNGRESLTVPLDQGANRLAVQVTEPDGVTVTTYTIEVVRLAPATNVFPVIADAYVFQNDPTKNYGMEEYLQVVGIPNAKGGGVRMAYAIVDFGSFAEPIDEAKFYFHVDESLSKNVRLKVEGFPDASWKETEVNWNTRPRGDNRIEYLTVREAGWYSVDVTSFARSLANRKGTIKIWDEALAETLVNINSLQHAVNHPYLVVNPSSHAALSGLTLSAGRLVPDFSETNSSYAAIVPAGTTSLAVTPVAAAPYVDIAVNGTPAQSGRQSQAVALSGNDDRIEIVVKAQNGSEQTYTIAVEQAEGPADPHLSRMKASPHRTSADGKSSSTIVVALKDAGGKPLPNRFVELDQAGGSSQIASYMQGMTNEDGEAIFTVTNTKAETVIYTATVPSDGITIRKTAKVKFFR